MASTVVAILDRDEWTANTDIIVVADGRRHRLTWVPRDLWSARLGARINAAFRRGGCAELIATLVEFGFSCDAALVLRRAATEAALAPVAATVPVTRRLDYWYPLAPNLPIEDGRKQVSFTPPAELLSGERLHQWIGARKPVTGDATDFDRLDRQQVLLRALLAQRFDFRTALVDPQLVQSVGDPLTVLQAIDLSWRMATFRRTRPVTIEGKMVLLRTPWHYWFTNRAARALEKLLRVVGLRNSDRR